MSTSVTQPATRITCSEVSPQNKHGRPKLVVEFATEETTSGVGLWVWCRYCHKPFFVSREACMAAWEQREPVMKGCGHK